LITLSAFSYNSQLSPTPSTPTRLAPFPNIALIATFTSKIRRHRRIRIATTHLHWDPEFCDTKLVQAVILSEWLAKNGAGTGIPTIIAGDLNSQPHEPPIRYLLGDVTAKESFGGFDFGNFTQLESLMSPIRFSSAYSSKDLPYTNKTDEFCGTLDHILYGAGSIEVMDVVGSVGSSRPSYLDQIESLPNEWFPSDHLPLIACFNWGRRDRRRPSLGAAAGLL